MIVGKYVEGVKTHKPGGNYGPRSKWRAQKNLGHYDPSKKNNYFHQRKKYTEKKATKVYDGGESGL